MARVWAVGAGFFLFVWVSCAAADNSYTASESQAGGSSEEMQLARQIYSLRKEILEVQAEYESWAARVGQTLWNLNKPQDIPDSRVQVTEDSRNELSQGRNEGVGAQKKQDTTSQTKAASPAVASPSSRKASAEAKINQNQKLTKTSGSTASNKGNNFIGVPLSPNQQNKSINSDTSPSKGVRIVYPKVTVVGTTNSVNK